MCFLFNRLQTYDVLPSASDTDTETALLTNSTKRSTVASTPKHLSDDVLTPDNHNYHIDNASPSSHRSTGTYVYSHCLYSYVAT